MKTKRASSVSLAVLNTACAVIWICVGVREWPGHPAAMVAAVVWVLAAVVHWVRVYRAYRNKEESS